LIADGDCRKKLAGVVREISGGFDPVVQILVDVVHQKLDRVARQDNEDDHPQNLAKSRCRMTCMAQTTD